MRRLLAALALSACTAAGADDDAASSDGALSETAAARDSVHAVQMNDVSILFPLPKSKSELARGLLPASAVLPEALYATAVGRTGPGGTPTVPYADLRVVAVRFDPCFARLGPGLEGACQNQMRLVLQPVSAPNTAADAAVHVFYALDRTALVQALDAVVALRLGHDGGKRMGPLAVHPILKAQGLLGPMAQGLRDIVARHAKDLVRFTTFSSSGLGTAWNFSGFDVANGKSTPMIVPTLPAGTTSVAFFRGFAPKTLSGDFTPPTTAADNLQLLGDAGRAERDEAGRRAAFAAAVRIENPNLHSPDTIDCASCHAAEPAIDMVATRRFGLTRGAGAFVADARYMPAVDLAHTTKPKDDDDVDVHMFSWEGSTPSIHQRTINETAAIVAALAEAKLLRVE